MMEKTCGMKKPFVFWKASMKMFPFFFGMNGGDHGRPLASCGPNFQVVM